LLGQLLGECTSTPSLSQECNGPCQTPKVNTGVLSKSNVFGTNQCCHQPLWQVCITHVGPVFSVKTPQLSAIHSINAGGQVRFGVGQSLGVGQLRGRGQGQQTREPKHRGEQGQPKQQAGAYKTVFQRLFGCLFSWILGLLGGWHGCETDKKIASAPARCLQRVEKALKMTPDQAEV